MKNIALFIISLLFSITSFAQTSYMEEIYKKGVSNFIFENYKTADSLFSLYINKYDKIDIDAYYNLAVSKLKLADTCGFCHNLWKATVLGDLEANAIFKEICLPYKEKLQQFYKTNDSLNSNRPEKSLTYNYLFDIAIYKSEVGDFCSLCKILENDSIFPETENDDFDKQELFFIKEKIDRHSGLNVLEDEICWIKNKILVDSLKTGIGIFNIISTHKCTNKKKYEYFENDMLYSDSYKSFILITSEIQKGHIMKVKENKINNKEEYVLYIDTTETKSKNFNNYLIKNINQFDSYLTYIQKLPEYVGGEEKLYKYLGKNIVYPTIARENNISGIVIINFIVEKDGSISNARIIKEIGGGCGLEALRVVRAMPKWVPGKQDGKPIRVFFNLPIKFTLSN